MQPGERINMDDAADVKRWTQRFGVDDQQLRSAVSAIGENPAEVARFLGQPLEQPSDQLAPPASREDYDESRLNHLAGTKASGGAGPAGGGEN